MVSEARVEANRNNPRTHGLSAPSVHAETSHPLYPARLAEWSKRYLVTSPEAHFALETAVAMTFRIDDCQVRYREAMEEDRERAEHAWDVDREAEAEALIGRIGRWPGPTSRKLATTVQGVDALLRAWARLAEALDSDWGDWSDAQRSVACDLLGLAPDLRDGRLPFDPREPDGDHRESRRRFIASEISRLQKLKEGGLVALDRLARERGARGGSALQSDRVRLALRYEREARRRYEAAMETIRFEHEAFCNAAYVATGQWPFKHYYEPATAVEPPMVVTVGAFEPPPRSARPEEAGAVLMEIAGQSNASPSGLAGPVAVPVPPVPAPSSRTTRPGRESRRRAATASISRQEDEAPGSMVTSP